jgi:hypothetical protein
MVTHVQEWLRTARRHSAIFLFLNIMDSHSPYKLREQNPTCRPVVTRAQAQEVLQVLAKGLDQYLCTATPRPRP